MKLRSTLPRHEIIFSVITLDMEWRREGDRIRKPYIMSIIIRCKYEYYVYIYSLTTVDLTLLTIKNAVSTANHKFKPFTC